MPRMRLHWARCWHPRSSGDREPPSLSDGQESTEKGSLSCSAANESRHVSRGDDDLPMDRSQMWSLHQEHRVKRAPFRIKPESEAFHKTKAIKFVLFDASRITEERNLGYMS